MSSKNKRLRGIVWLYEDGSSEYNSVESNPKSDSIIGLFLQNVRNRLRNSLKYSPTGK